MKKNNVLANLVVVLILLLLKAEHASAASRNGQGSANVTLVLNNTLSGDPTTHYPITVVLTSTGGEMQVDFFAPYLGEDAVQRIHTFIANKDKHITEIEIDTGKGVPDKTKMLVRLYWAPFNVLRKIDTFTPKSIKNYNGTLSGTVTLPVEFLPPQPFLANAAVEHILNDDTHWDNFYSVTNNGIAIPDLMVLARYKQFNPSILSSATEYSPEWKSD